MKEPVAYADWHTHTRYSHGKGTVLENVYAAGRRGLQEIALADHGPANLFGVGVKDLNTFSLIRRDIAAAKRRVPEVDVLYAVEANIVDTDGTIDIPGFMQDEFDLVLVGLHVLVRPHSIRRVLPVVTSNILAKLHRQGERGALVKNTDMLTAAVRRNRVHIVTHPGYRLPIDTYELAQTCALTGTALEINSRHALTADELRRAAATGVWFVIGSDAHEPAQVGALTAGWRLAQQAGIEPWRILNFTRAGRERLRR